MQATLEVWKPIPGYDLYEASSLGRIKRVVGYTIAKNGRVMKYQERVRKPCIQNNGYLIIGLCLNNKVDTYLVHRLIAMTFIPNPENLYTVNHIDHNRLNNSVENLEWMSQAQNMRYASINKRLPTGQDHKWAKLTEQQAMEIKYSTTPLKETAEKYSVTTATISGIRRGKRWRNLSLKTI